MLTPEYIVPPDLSEKSMGYAFSDALSYCIQTVGVKGGYGRAIAQLGKAARQNGLVVPFKSAAAKALGDIRPGCFDDSLTDKHILQGVANAGMDFDGVLPPGQARDIARSDYGVTFLVNALSTMPDALTYMSPHRITEYAEDSVDKSAQGVRECAEVHQRTGTYNRNTFAIPPTELVQVYARLASNQQREACLQGIDQGVAVYMERMGKVDGADDIRAVARGARNLGSSTGGIIAYELEKSLDYFLPIYGPNPGQSAAPVGV